MFRRLEEKKDLCIGSIEGEGERGRGEPPYVFTHLFIVQQSFYIPAAGL